MSSLLLSTTKKLKLEPSIKSQNTRNPIRNIVDNLVRPINHEKSFINLGLGDPTVAGNIPRPIALTNILIDILKDSCNDGYGPSVGLVSARKAVALTQCFDDYKVSEENVIIASGCSGALELVISVLVNPGDNILIPCPGFSLYQVLVDSLLGNVKKYNLLPNNNWECDLQHMESLIDNKTKAILINNPSNPCGSNFSKEHLLNIIEIAKKYNLPIIADEIYGGVVFHGNFTPIHSLTCDIPIFTVGGIAKEFVVPGWRVGWVIVHDRTQDNIASELLKGLKSLSQLILGANSVIQACLPRLLSKDINSNDYNLLQEFHTSYHNILRNNADLCCDEIAKCNKKFSLLTGNNNNLLSINKPTGAMYTMIGINMDLLDNELKNDTDFARLLLTEQNLSVLPGICFGMKDYVRFVICPGENILRDAFERLYQFCINHLKK